MTYLLDSDVCIDLLNESRASDRTRRVVDPLASEGLAISVITFGEVYEGVLFSRRRAADHAQWTEFLAGVDVIDCTQPIAEIWADLRGQLRRAGSRLADNDLLIAATAIDLGLTLITRNLRHFDRVAGLRLQLLG